MKEVTEFSAIFVEKYVVESKKVCICDTCVRGITGVGNRIKLAVWSVHILHNEHSRKPNVRKN